MENHLRTIRHARGVTIKQLASTTGYAASTIRNFENGTTEVSAGLLGKLAGALSCSVSAILRGPSKSLVRRIANGDNSVAALDPRGRGSRSFAETLHTAILSHLVTALSSEQLSAQLSLIPADDKLCGEEKIALMALISTELVRRLDPAEVMTPPLRATKSATRKARTQARAEKRKPSTTPERSPNAAAQS